jgi:two-component system chemotaxis response regulator CheY
MKCLIVEDDFISRRVMKELLATYFESDIAVNGEEAVTAFRLAHESKKPYDLICMDIMMPVVDGNEALRQIRDLERKIGIPPEIEVKVIMTTALDDPKTVIDSFYKSGATSYLVKPISKHKLMRELRSFRLIS